MRWKIVWIGHCQALVALDLAIQRCTILYHDAPKTRSLQQKEGDPVMCTLSLHTLVYGMCTLPRDAGYSRRSCKYTNTLCWPHLHFSFQHQRWFSGYFPDLSVTRREMAYQFISRWDGHVIITNQWLCQSHLCFLKSWKIHNTNLY